MAPGRQETIIAKVKVPPVSGNYTLRWDLIHQGVTWFSDQGIPTHNKAISVNPPSYASVTHLGSEGYYTKIGPVDVATGNLTFSTTDQSVASNAGPLSFTRTYNSNNLEDLFDQDSNGYIRHWLINGPYREGNQSIRLTKEYIPSEHLVRPSLGSTSSGNNWFVGSEPTTSQIWFNWIFWGAGAYQLDALTNAAAYAHVYVYSPTTRGAQLRLGSDDGARVWLNGNLVLHNDVYRGSF
jgi:hypothetical protein